MYVNVSETEACCANCTNFHQHYVRYLNRYGGASYYAIPHGHCDYPRLKDRKVLDLCEHYEPRNVIERKGG